MKIVGLDYGLQPRNSCVLLLANASINERTGMGKVIVMNWVTLDGVMQGPGRQDEDARDGFEHGGWATPYGDETTGAKMGERMGPDRAFVFGRRTYEELLTSWNAQGGPFKDALNDTRKFVASGNPETSLLLIVGSPTGGQAATIVVASFAVAFVVHASVAEAWVRATRKSDAPRADGMEAA